MPRYVLTDNERTALQAYLQGQKPETHGYMILSRLRKMTVQQLRDDMALLERIYEKITK